MLTLLNWISRCAARLSLDRALRLGRGLGWCIGHLLRYRRATARKAMTLAFPEKGAAEVATLLDNMYAHLGMNLVETMRCSVLGLAELEGRIRVEGIEHYRALASSEQGALVLMGHLGNWELAAYGSTLTERALRVVVKPMQPAALEKYVTRLREKMGMQVLPFRGAYRECLKAVKAGDLLVNIIDQNTRRSIGVFVDFFGRPACTTPGLAIMAAQTQAPVIPLHMYRESDRDHVLVVGEPVPPPPDRQPETLRAATQAYTRILEDNIRQHPGQWTWIHKRWKVQPAPEAGDVFTRKSKGNA